MTNNEDKIDGEKDKKPIEVGIHVDNQVNEEEKVEIEITPLTKKLKIQSWYEEEFVKTKDDPAKIKDIDQKIDEFLQDIKKLPKLKIENDIKQGNDRIFEYASGLVKDITDENGLKEFKVDSKFNGVITVKRRDPQTKQLIDDVDILEYSEGKLVALVYKGGNRSETRVKNTVEVRDIQKQQKEKEEALLRKIKAPIKEVAIAIEAEEVEITGGTVEKKEVTVRNEEEVANKINIEQNVESAKIEQVEENINKTGLKNAAERATEAVTNLVKAAAYAPIAGSVTTGKSKEDLESAAKRATEAVTNLVKAADAPIAGNITTGESKEEQLNNKKTNQDTLDRP